jgi:hypothetical protein
MKYVLLIVLYICNFIYGQGAATWNIPEFPNNYPDKTNNGGFLVSGFFNNYTTTQNINNIDQVDRFSLVAIGSGTLLHYGTSADMSTPINVSTLYNSIGANSAINNDGELVVAIYYYRCLVGNCPNNTPPNNYFGIRMSTIRIKGAKKWTFYNGSYCAKTNYNLTNGYGCLNHTGGSYSIITGSQPSGTTITNNILDLTGVSTSGNVNIQYKTVLSAGASDIPGVIAKVFNRAILEEPNVSWANPTIQTGLILTSHPCIDLTGTAMSTTTSFPGFNLYYASAGTPTGIGTSFCPNLSGSGGFFINAIAEYTVNNTTCKSQISQEVTITNDPGIPGKPFLNGWGRGRSPSTPVAYNPPFHLCDGQETMFWVEPSTGTPADVDTVEYVYVENGNDHYLGKVLKYEPITVTLAKTNEIRTDYIKVRGWSNLGVPGAFHTFEIQINKVGSLLDQINDTTCLMSQFSFTPDFLDT